MKFICELDVVDQYGQYRVYDSIQRRLYILDDNYDRVSYDVVLEIEDSDGHSN
ncbi:MAG: hypothetical protein AB1695_12525 [Stygiobacter sp.]